MLPLTTIVKKIGDGIFTILPSGSIDSDTCDTLEASVKTVFDSDPKALIFDMKGVKYISSMGIRVLLTSRSKIEGKGGSMVLINLQPQIRKVLDIVKAIPSQYIFTSTEELDNYLAIIQRKEIEKRGS